MARPTDHLDEVVRFYSEGLGLTKVGSFEDHERFDGVMLGVPGAPYHLEFTRKRGHSAGRAPTEENLLAVPGSRWPHVRRPGRLPRGAAEYRVVHVSSSLMAASPAPEPTRNADHGDAWRRHFSLSSRCSLGYDRPTKEVGARESDKAPRRATSAGDDFVGRRA